MGNFVISKDVFDKIPGLIVISGLLKVGKPAKEAISSYLNDSWRKISQEVSKQGYKNYPLIAQWREALRGAGVPLKRCPPSIEAIAKRATKINTPFSINPVVDTYNAISMELVLPFGAFDTTQLDGSLYLRVSNGHEPFVPLGSGEPQETEEGEIVYADTSDILTRHFLWRQAEKGKITEQSTECMFLCELLESMGEQTLQKATRLIEDRFFSLLDGSLRDVTIHKWGAGRS